MSSSGKQICLHCRWWRALDFEATPAHQDTNGQCRLSAPFLVQIGSFSEGLDTRTAWPGTRGGDSCGEFTSRCDDQYEHVKGEFIAGVGMTYRRADGSHTEECRCRWCAEAVLRGTAEPKSFDNWTTLGEASKAAIKGLKP